METNWVRFNDKLWGYPRGVRLGGGSPTDLEIQVKARDYRTSLIAKAALDRFGLFHGRRTVAIGDHHWEVGHARKSKSMMQRLTGLLPMFQKSEEAPVVKLQIRTPEHIHTPDLRLMESELSDLNSVPTRPLPDSELDWRLADEPLNDPFTQLTSWAFQTWEKEFSTNREASPTFQFAIEDSTLRLVPYNPSLSQADHRQMNRQVLRRYLVFLRKEYGRPLMREIEYAYHIDFKKMYERGEPLTPEIVYRMNVGTHNVEVQHLDLLLQCLRFLREDLNHLAVKEETLEQFLVWYDQGARAGGALPRRELKALYRYLQREAAPAAPTLEHLAGFLDDLLETGSRAQHLDERQVSSLMEILWPPQETWDRIFSGRKIVHKAIMGFYTIADKSTFKPWLDLHELLQVLPSCGQCKDLESYLELLSHVVCKKHLVRQHPDDLWRVGAIIPAPPNYRGEPRWFTVTSCLDNHLGVFNYTLEPTCGKSTLPFVKLYRSTASNSYAMNGRPSILADLDPSHAPGGAKKWKGDKYELPYIKKRTLPVWVGYYLKALGQEAQLPEGLEDRCRHRRSVLEDYHKAVLELCEGRLRELSKPFEVKDDDRPRLAQIRRRREVARQHWQSVLTHYKAQYRELPQVFPHASPIQLAKMEEALILLSKQYAACLKGIAEVEKELPQHKKAQDLYFVGHSLGGGLSQGGLYHFGPFRERIPLPGCSFLCYSSDATKLSPGENDDFLRFGEEHKELLQALGQKWKVIQSLEYGDLIALAGEYHLGASKADHSSWLDFQGTLFKPKPHATHLEVYDPPTHGRRFGKAEKDRDFEQTILSPQELHEFNRSYWLSPDQQRRWGFPSFVSPRLAEWSRRTVGYIQAPVTKWLKRLWDWISPPRGHEMRDSNRYFFIALTEDGGTELKNGM